MQLFLRGLLCAVMFFAVTAVAQAQSSMADGEPGISSYAAADEFCDAFFPVRSDCTISPDPDGGYYISYSLADYDPLVVQSALKAFLTVSDEPIDFEAQAVPVGGDLETGARYNWNIYGRFIEDPAASFIDEIGGQLYVPVLLQFDHNRDGFSAATTDFEVTTVVPVDRDGYGTVTVTGVSYGEVGDWRYRTIVDPNGLYESLTDSTRGDNTSAWSDFRVVADPDAPVTPDESSWKLISDFDSYGPAYVDQASGGTTCTSLRGWTCDVRPGEPLPQIDMFVDGVLYDTFYPSITRDDTIDPWWADRPEYGNMPGCPARPGNPYGFNYLTPAALKDGAEHTVELRATRSDGHSNYIVNAGWTPVIQEFTVQCAPETSVIDLSGQLNQIGDQYIDEAFTLPGVSVRNQGTNPTGQPVVVEVHFDFGTDGFQPGSTEDFVLTQTLSAMAAGAQITPSFGGVTLSELGAWRVRLVVDPAASVEPTTSGYRANNVTPWRSFNVIDGVNVISDINITALSRQNVLPPANPDGTRNVRFNTEVLGLVGETVPYTLTMVSSENTYTQSGTVTGMPAVFTPSLQINNVAIGLYDVMLEVDLPAPGVVTPEAEEVRNNSRVLTNMAVPPEPPLMVIEPDQELVRIGDTTDLTITVETPYELECTVMGNGIDISFTTSGTMDYTNTVTTPALNSAAVYELSCTEPVTTTTWDNVESRINVVAEPEEI